MAKQAVKPSKVRQGLLIVAGLALIIIFMVAIWWARVPAAVVSHGQLVIMGGNYPIQARDSGVVATVLVQVGDQVEPDTPLVQLDDSRARYDLVLLSEQLIRTLFQQAAALAEVDSHQVISRPEVPARVAKLLSAAFIEELWRQTVTEFTARLQQWQSEKEIVSSQLEQTSLLLAGNRQRLQIIKSQLDLAQQELDRQRQLRTTGLVAEAEFLRRKNELSLTAAQLVQLETEISVIVEQQHELQQRLEAITAERLAVAAANQQRLAEVLASRREQFSQLQQQVAYATLRAPVAGVVFDLTTQVGALVGAGERLLTIVPTETELILQTSVPPEKINLVRIGQPVVAQFHLTTANPPEVDGRVVRIAPEVKIDESGEPAYLVEVALGDTAVLETEVSMRPGLTAQVLLRGEERRTIISLFTQPFATRLERARQ